MKTNEKVILQFDNIPATLKATEFPKLVKAMFCAYDATRDFGVVNVYFDNVFATTFKANQFEFRHHVRFAVQHILDVDAISDYLDRVKVFSVIVTVIHHS